MTEPIPSTPPAEGPSGHDQTLAALDSVTKLRAMLDTVTASEVVFRSRVDTAGLTAAMKVPSLMDSVQMTAGLSAAMKVPSLMDSAQMTAGLSAAMKLPRVTDSIRVAGLTAGMKIPGVAGMKLPGVAGMKLPRVTDGVQMTGLTAINATTSALGARLGSMLTGHADLVRLASVKPIAAYDQALLVVGAEAAAAYGLRTSMVAAQAAQIVSAQDSLTRLVETRADAFGKGLSESLIRYWGVQEQLGVTAVGSAGPVMLRGYTRASAHDYDLYLKSLAVRPTTDRATVARLGADAQSGLLVGEALTSDISDDDRAELAERLSPVVRGPWEVGLAAWQTDLYEALEDVEAGLADWLRGAWENIDRDSFKAASFVANAVVECVDRTLRNLAPLDDVMRWMPQRSRPANWLNERGAPTRRAKVMFAMRDRPARDANLAASQVEVLQQLVSSWQSVKHADPASILVVRSWVVSTEAALCQLLQSRRA